jgi:quercetin dioxygenase-like cupin family protein
VVIIPPGVVHWFVNTGDDFLRHTAVHEAPAHDVTYLDENPDAL